MRVSNIALAAVLALSADVNHGQSPSSKYHYKPGGVIFNSKFLPGPDQWPGVCNDASAVEQTPIAIDTSDPSVETKDDFEPTDYTFNVSYIRLGGPPCAACRSIVKQTSSKYSPATVLLTS